jgi:glutamate-1-semialdehyde 2,1-aminomutase
MEKIAPSGPVYQAGTLSGNPLAMTAGMETLRILSEPGVYKTLDETASLLCDGLKGAADEAGINAVFNRVGSLFTMFFTTAPAVTDYKTAKTCDTARFGKFFIGMLNRGIYLAPSQFEAGFMSLAHTKDDVWKTVEAAREVFKIL